MKSTQFVKKSQSGFTLIELMIIVAIIGILASISISYYQDSIARSKFGSALAEVAAGKVGVDTELTLVRDHTAAEILDYSKFPAAPTTNCSFTATDATDGSTTLVCAIVDGPATVNGQTITLTRNGATGIWTCGSTVVQKYIGASVLCKGA